MNIKGTTIWRVCIFFVLAILGAIYSPLILQAGVIEPWFLGLPYTLWTTVLGAFAIVLVTAVAAYFQPTDANAEDRPQTGCSE